MAATAAAPAQPKPDWHWSHPLPHGNNVADLVFRSGRYVHVTDHGGIYTSSNRLVWDRQLSGTTASLRGAAYLGDRLLVTGEAGTARWSDDAVRFQAATVTPATTDWLEGVAAATNRALAVAVGDNAAIYRTTDGLAWVRVEGLSFATWLTGVAYGAGVFVAVGDGGLIVSSADALAWTRRASGTFVDLSRVAFGDGRFVAVGLGGVVVTSANGIVWSADPVTGETNALLAATLAPGERFVVGESAAWLRKPPVVWQDQISALVSPAPLPEWTFAAAVWDGDRFLVGGRTGVFAESFRTNSGGFAGQTFWFRNDESPRNGLWEVARLGGGYLAVGDLGTVLSSTAGVTWTPEGAPVSSDVVLYGVGGSSEVALAVGSGGAILRSSAGFTNQLVTNLVVAGGRTNVLLTTNRLSLLGVIWESVTSPTTNTLQGVAWNGGRFVVTGANGTVLTSTDGVLWEVSPVAGAGFLSSVTAFGGGWVTAGTGGALYTSPDAVTWTPRTSGTTNWLYRVRDVGGRLVAVGQNGILLTSGEGENWTPQASGTGAWLTDIRQVGRYAYVCGTQGTLLRSTNLVDWLPVELPTGKSLYGLAAEGGQLVVVGAEGVILRAVADPEAAPVAMAAYAHFLDAVPPVDGFVFQGVPEQRFQWQRAAALGEWTDEAALELDLTGSSVRGRVAMEAVQFHRTATIP